MNPPEFVCDENGKIQIPDGFYEVVSGEILKGDFVTFGDASWEAAAGCIGLEVKEWVDGEYGYKAIRPARAIPSYQVPAWALAGKDQSNPKDIHGLKKPQLGLLPAAGKVYGAIAMQNGAAKYGAYNWRNKKVRASIYFDAIERHLLALRDGEDTAPDSGTPHLGHIIACAAILADAIEGGFLIDDRPIKGPGAAVLEKFTKK